MRGNLKKWAFAAGISLVFNLSLLSVLFQMPQSGEIPQLQSKGRIRVALDKGERDHQKKREGANPAVQTNRSVQPCDSVRQIAQKKRGGSRYLSKTQSAMIDNRSTLAHVEEKKEEEDLKILIDISLSGKTEEDGVTLEFDKERYLKMIRDEIYRHKRYPKTALLKGIEGEALISFAVDSDGNVADMEIKKSSGYEILNSAAMEAVQRASPFLPHGLNKSLRVEVPFKFRVKE